MCVADALDVLFELTVRFARGESLRTAAFEVNERRMCDRLELSEQHLEASPFEKYPKASLILFLGLSTQYVNLYYFYIQNISTDGFINQSRALHDSSHNHSIKKPISNSQTI
jgi:hypothetical protein